MAKILAVFTILITTLPALGQDVHYSQYFNCPLSLNPAETGNFEGDWRGIANYRNQWSALGIPYNTLAASYDQQLTIKNVHLSPGFYVISDNSDNAVLLVNSVYASLGYHNVFDNNYLSAGIQIGAVFKRLDYSKLSFPDQFEENPEAVYNPVLPTTAIGKDNVTYLDFNAGVSWKRRFKNYEPEVGLAFFHLNGPNGSFFDQTTARVPVRKTIYASLKTDINPNVYIKPGIMLFAVSGFNDMMIGSQIGWTMQGNSLNVSEATSGIYLRNGILNNTDAIMVMFGAQIHNLNITISYDINISPLSSYTNGQGAFEISLIYRNISSIIKTFTIPCERI